MKILKPGKVEMRKFVCPRCGCIFAVSRGENVIRQGSRYPDTAVIACPEQGCNGGIVVWSDGEPYEEPTPTLTLDEVQKLMKVIEEFKGDLSRISFSDVALIRFCKHLIANGVTFMEG